VHQHFALHERERNLARMLLETHRKAARHIFEQKADIFERIHSGPRLGRQRAVSNEGYNNDCYYIQCFIFVMWAEKDKEVWSGRCLLSASLRVRLPADRVELRIRAPFGPAPGIGKFAADGMEQRHILGGAAQVPG
jgi:hypothetical protein